MTSFIIPFIITLIAVIVGLFTLLVLFIKLIIWLSGNKKLKNLSNSDILILILSRMFPNFFIFPENENLSSTKGYNEHLGLQNYQSKELLMTPTETLFFHHLIRAINQEKHHINCSVRLWSIIKVKPSVKEKWRDENKINRKEIDFIITDKNSLKIILAVELDDHTHNRTDRIKRDKFVNDLFRSVGIPLLRIPAQDSYNIRALQNKINRIISPDSILIN